MVNFIHTTPDSDMSQKKSVVTKAKTRQPCLSIQMTAATQKTRLKIIAAGPYTQYSYVVVKKII